MSDESESAVARAADEVKLQAWLARAELRNPSLHDPATRSEVDALAAMRDELAVQIHLGKLEARDEWTHLENRWAQVKHTAENAVSELGERFHDLLREIRDGYKKLRERRSQ